MKFYLALLVALALSEAVNARSTTLRKTDDLNKILREFYDLIPLDKVAGITQVYELEDVEFQRVVKFFLSENFTDFVRAVDSIEDVIKFYDYLQEAGMDIYQQVNSLHDVLGLPLLPTGNYPKIPSRSVTITGGFAGFLSDVKGFLPHEHIKALFDEKMETSPAFARFVKHLRSPRFEEVVNNLRDNEEFQTISNFAKEHGVDFRAVMDLAFSVFGLEFPKGPSHDLHNVLTEFIDLVPLDKVAGITQVYELEDVEFQRVVKFFLSENFADFVRAFDSIEDVIKFYDYLQEAGMDIYRQVNSLHDVLGLPLLPSGNYPKISSRSVRITGGFAGFLSDVKGFLPHEHIKALFHEKIETSPAFARFVKHLRSPRFEEVVNNLRNNEEFQTISNFAKEHGVDFTAVMDLIFSVFGLEFPSENRFSN